MKKVLFTSLLTAALLLTASCGSKISKPAPSSSTSPKPTATVSSSPKGNDDKNNDAISDNQTEGEASSSENSSQAESISIINGSEKVFYAVYIAKSSSSTLGENIIGDTPLGEGEEIELPYANIGSDELIWITVEDENGIQYTTSSFSLADGLTIELRFENGELQAVTQ